MKYLISNVEILNNFKYLIPNVRSDLFELFEVTDCLGIRNSILEFITEGSI